MLLLPQSPTFQLHWERLNLEHLKGKLQMTEAKCRLLNQQTKPPPLPTWSPVNHAHLSMTTGEPTTCPAARSFTEGKWTAEVLRRNLIHFVNLCNVSPSSPNHRSHLVEKGHHHNEGGAQAERSTGLQTKGSASICEIL